MKAVRRLDHRPCPDRRRVSRAGDSRILYRGRLARRAAAWKKARTDIEAEGLSLDRAALIPPPIPDAENFAAIPLFKVTEDPKHPTFWRCAALESAIADTLSHIAPDIRPTPVRTNSLSSLHGPDSAHVDRAALRQRIASVGQALQPPVSIPSDVNPAQAFDLLCPSLAALRKENERRPGCIFARVLERTPPFAPSYAYGSSLIHLNRVLVYQERLALMDGSIPLLLGDWDVAWKLISGLQKQPSLLSSLIASALIEMQLSVLEEALDRRLVDDAALARVGDQLRKFDLLASGQYWIAGDVVDFNRPYMEYYRDHRDVSLQTLDIMRGEFPG